jgi:4-carboxymuconolactone decarboxylase
MLGKEGNTGEMTDRGKSPAQELLGDTAPELVRLTDDVLFGQVRADPALPQRDRSLITISVLAALGRTEQLRLPCPGPWTTA